MNIYIHIYTRFLESRSEMRPTFTETYFQGGLACAVFLFGRTLLKLAHALDRGTEESRRRDHDPVEVMQPSLANGRRCVADEDVEKERQHHTDPGTDQCRPENLIAVEVSWLLGVSTGSIALRHEVINPESFPASGPPMAPSAWPSNDFITT